MMLFDGCSIKCDEADRYILHKERKKKKEIAFMMKPLNELNHMTRPKISIQQFQRNSTLQHQKAIQCPIKPLARFIALRRFTSSACIGML